MPAALDIMPHKDYALVLDTGIGAMACIHGAFVPDSVVDFQKGEG